MSLKRLQSKSWHTAERQSLFLASVDQSLSRLPSRKHSRTPPHKRDIRLICRDPIPPGHINIFYLRHLRMLGSSRTLLDPVHSYTITKITIWHVFHFRTCTPTFNVQVNDTHVNSLYVCVSLAVTFFLHELIRWNTSDDHVFWVNQYRVCACRRCTCCSYITYSD